ncbi:MAG: Nif3-like dinuclear metal center hexameric protein [Sulfurimonas sp.]|nr:Nif3-like dinuclear metal center hexameric protein [Sulfurimonas sp.]
MKLSQIYKILDEISPFELQEEWDNSGIQVGSLHQEIKKIVLSIDVDDELIDSLDVDTLLITHHPIIFSGLKQINFDKYPSNLLQKMIKKNISNIAMHTNFDKTHLNEFVAKEILGYKIIKQDGFGIYLDINENFDKFIQNVKEKFLLKNTKFVKCSNFIKTAVLTTGSGCSLIPEITAECFLTGDIKYHDAMQAKSINLSLIDIGHFESECFFSEILQKHLKNLGLEAIIASSKNPFTYI